MTAQELLDALNRLIHDEMIQPDSIVIVRSAGSTGAGIEMVIEKPAARVVAAEPSPGQRIVKIIGL
ncbi:MAG: hypothetical protein PHE55_12820 [Methylococcaceae bacterium]|nr:hypothetical protein [Methylococcaceae bacterium]